MLSEKVKTIGCIILIVAFGIIATLMITIANGKVPEQAREAKYLQFKQECDKMDNDVYMVIREDIEEVYLKCSK